MAGGCDDLGRAGGLFLRLEPVPGGWLHDGVERERASYITSESLSIFYSLNHRFEGRLHKIRFLYLFTFQQLFFISYAHSREPFSFFYVFSVGKDLMVYIYIYRIPGVSTHYTLAQGISCWPDIRWARPILLTSVCSPQSNGPT
jgi:hypothetical protein